MGLYDRDYIYTRSRKRNFFATYFMTKVILILVISLWVFILIFPSLETQLIFSNNYNTVKSFLANIASFFVLEEAKSLWNFLYLYIFYIFSKQLESYTGKRVLYRFICFFIFFFLLVLYFFPYLNNLNRVSFFSYLIYVFIFVFAWVFPFQPLDFLFFLVLPIRIYARHLIWILLAYQGFQFLAYRKIDWLFFLTWGVAFIAWHFFREKGLKSNWKKFFSQSSLKKKIKSKSKESSIDEKVLDPILDKIIADGMDSLTNEERGILKKYSEDKQK